MYKCKNNGLNLFQQKPIVRKIMETQEMHNIGKIEKT